ncbi:hypothetical protein E4U55_000667 [Claviceps digitariae]|nr:hypothetical protein E4U55_000667 [Claviceps digitariae]
MTELPSNGLVFKIDATPGRILKWMQSNGSRDTKGRLPEEKNSRRGDEHGATRLRNEGKK